MKSRKSPVLATQGGCTARHDNGRSIAAPPRSFNEELTLAPDEEFINQQLVSCADSSSLKREIIKLFINGLLPHATVERLFAKYDLRGCRS